ncbi:hypothetical protein LCGC14_0363460 [marine sediment metagenome]|uniref:Uncharacterized protein n=1 Tax=marine sediment metagenome TaxID=412755 RepID=A0A0F9TD69_9ZZZZ
MINSEQTRKEFKRGIIVMSLVFIWGLLGMLIISALLGKFYIWHLSWNLVPVVAFLAALMYDVKHEEIPDVEVEPKPGGVWTELGEDKITIIREASPLVEKKYTGIY